MLITRTAAQALEESPNPVRTYTYAPQRTTLPHTGSGGWASQRIKPAATATSLACVLDACPRDIHMCSNACWRASIPNHLLGEPPAGSSHCPPLSRHARRVPALMHTRRPVPPQGGCSLGRQPTEPSPVCMLHFATTTLLVHAHVHAHVMYMHMCMLMHLYMCMCM